MATETAAPWKPTQEDCAAVAADLARLSVSAKTLFRGVVEFWPDHTEAMADGWRALRETWAELERRVPNLRETEDRTPDA